MSFVCSVVELCCVLFSWFFFFKQKTAYEMRISDWSSDVCSSDLPARRTARPGRKRRPPLPTRPRTAIRTQRAHSSRARRPESPRPRSIAGSRANGPTRRPLPKARQRPVRRPKDTVSGGGRPSCRAFTLYEHAGQIQKDDGWEKRVSHREE